MPIIEVFHNRVPQHCSFRQTNRKNNCCFQSQQNGYHLRWSSFKNLFSRLPRHFFEEAYRVLSGSNREVSSEPNQILSEAGCSLIFTPNEYYGGGRTPLVIDCRTVADGHIHGGGMELSYSVNELQTLITRTSTSGTIDVAVFVVLDAIANRASRHRTRRESRTRFTRFTIAMHRFLRKSA